MALRWRTAGEGRPGSGEVPHLRSPLDFLTWARVTARITERPRTVGQHARQKHDGRDSMCQRAPAESTHTVRPCDDRRGRQQGTETTRSHGETMAATATSWREGRAKCGNNTTASRPRADRREDNAPGKPPASNLPVTRTPVRSGFAGRCHRPRSRAREGQRNQPQTHPTKRRARRWRRARDALARARGI